VSLDATVKIFAEDSSPLAADDPVKVTRKSVAVYTITVRNGEAR
jgi:hypothetical protein